MTQRADYQTGHPEWNEGPHKFMQSSAAPE